MDPFIGGNIAVMSVPDGQAIIHFSSHRDALEAGKIHHVGRNEVQYWGVDNLLPQTREQLVQANNIIPSLMQTKRDILVGSGVVPYNVIFENGKKRVEEVECPGDITDWMEKSSFDNYLLQSCSDLLMHANVFPEFIRTRDKSKISLLSAKKARHLRLAKQNKQGDIDTAYWSGNWKEATTNYKPKPINIYDPKQKQNKFLMHLGDTMFMLDEYYYSPSWWGGKDWIELSNGIPPFHIANLNNGFNIRFHIMIPVNYFDKYTAMAQVDRTPEGQQKAKSALAAAKQDLIDRLNEWLAKPKNAGRAFFSTYKMTQRDGKMFGGIVIEPIKYDMKDEALISLFDKSNEANMSSQGVHPTLANIQTQGKLSSGSEIRNAYLMYVAIKTPVPRRTLLKPLNFIRKENGWDKKYPDIKGFMFKDMEITKLDDDKSGSSEIITEDGKQ